MAPKGTEKSSDISFFGQIAGNEIVSSGSIVSHSRDEIVINPFADDREYALSVLVAFSATTTPSVDLLDSDPEEKKVKILFRRRFTSGEFFSNTQPLTVATTDDEAYDYLANFAINAFGEEGQFTLVLHYTIFKRKAT